MPETPENAFIGWKQAPTEAQLAEVLGAAGVLWAQPVTALSADHGVSTQEWKSYSAKSGWSLRLLKKKRNIVYLLPAKGGFRAAFVLGDKAVAAARNELPARIVKLIDAATRYPEGTGIRVEIRKPADVQIALQLAAIKLAT